MHSECTLCVVHSFKCIKAVLPWSVYAGEGCGMYDGREYVQERSAKGVTACSMCRKGMCLIIQCWLCAVKKTVACMVVCA